MLTKDVVVGLVTVIADTMQLQVREDTVVRDDEKELSRTYHRYVASPGDDTSQRAELVQRLAALLWTAAVIAKWKAIEAANVPVVTP